MARSKYIYHVYKRELNKECVEVSRHVASFTVKYESQAWAKKHWNLNVTYRTRMRDGGNHYRDGQEPEPCPWEQE